MPERNDKPVKTRDRERTKRDLIAAVGRAIASGGFRNLGVNAIAREAGVDKALIYRYFGGLEGLLDTFAMSAEHFPEISALVDEVRENNPDRKAALQRILVEFSRALRDNPIQQEILRWELVEKNALTDALADQREQRSMAAWRSAEAEMPPKVDMVAVASLLVAGMQFLLLRSKTYPVYNGIPIGEDEGWERLEAAARDIIDALL